MVLLLVVPFIVPDKTSTQPKLELVENEALKPVDFMMTSSVAVFGLSAALQLLFVSQLVLTPTQVLTFPPQAANET